MNRRDELASRTRTDLPAAAKRLFAERGYLDTKVTDIAAAAGRAAGSFYTHFGDKGQVLAVLRREFDEELPVGPGAGLNHAIPDGGPDDDRVAGTVTNLVLHGLIEQPRSPTASRAPRA